MSATTIYFLAGVCVGAIVPAVILSKTILRGLQMEIKHAADHEKRIIDIEAELDDLEDRVERFLDKRLTRDDVPYDALGDYSGMDIQPAQSGQQSPDEWYREQFGGGNEVQV